MSLLYFLNVSNKITTTILMVLSANSNICASYHIRQRWLDYSSYCGSCFPASLPGWQFGVLKKKDFDFFKEQFQVHSKIDIKVQRFPIYYLPNKHSLPHYQHAPPECTFFKLMKLCCHSIMPKVHRLYQDSLLLYILCFR